MSQVDEVRAASDIVKIVGEYVKLRKTGTNFVGLCPFHQEKTPSFAVHPVKQIFHCFGCGVGGDVFKFLMLIESLSFPEALRRVADKVGVRLAETIGDETYDANARIRAALYKMHEAASKFYSAQLTGTAEGRLARAYLADRGLTDEIVARFRLGYALADGQGLARQLAEARYEPEPLEKSGLVLFDAERQRRFDRFRRRIIFPIANESGKIVAFGGRALGDDHPKYLNSPETPIYTKSRVLYNLNSASSAIRKLEYAILVEGYMDCIAVASSGIENVVASCGTSLTESQIRLLGRYARRVVVNYDPDSAGVAATERSLALLLEEGFEAKVLALPDGLDPDSFIRKRGAEAYHERLAAAPTYLDYMTERAIAAHDVRTPEGKVAAANRVMPYLARIPNPMLRAELANRLAERLRLDERLLLAELKRTAGAGQSEIHARSGPATARITPAEATLLRAFLENEQLVDEFLPQIVAEGLFEGLATESIFKHFSELRLRREKLEPMNFENALPIDEQRIIFEQLLTSSEIPGVGEVRSCQQALRRRRVERESEKLQAEIRIAEQQKDFTRLAELLAAKPKLAKELRALAAVQKNSTQSQTN
jgi:DNA primase